MKNRFLLAWIFFHSAILLAFLASLAFSPKITFATSLFDILPPSSSLHEVQKADAALGAKTGRAVTILAQGESFESAKSAAEKLYSHYVDFSDGAAVVNPAFFDSLSLYVGSASVNEITDWLHEFRFSLLDDETVALLRNGGAEVIADDALASVYGAFSLSDLSTLAEDPFLLSEKKLRSLLSGGAISSTAMALRDDVLACERDGNWFVLIRGVVSEKGAALASRKSTVKNLYEICAKIKEENQIDFIFSGVPFHSYESSTSAQRQISAISTVALVLIVLVFLWIFRSPVPAIVSAAAVFFSCGIGFVATLLFFRGIHVLTFVFGTTLIGTCLDYSIHYFVNWKANLACDSGAAVRKHILRGITLGFASTEICFAALFLAPFPLLKQVSVFLFTGLATAYLSVVALYPMLKMPKKRRQNKTPSTMQNERSEPETRGTTPPFFLRFNRHDKIIRFVPLSLVLFSLVVILTNYRSLKIHNNIQELYTMSPEMLRNEIASAQILDTGSSGWYFIVKADSEENLLQRIESLDSELEKAKSDGKIRNFLSLAQFIPSEKKQRESFDSAKNLLPIVSQQYDALGFDSANLAVQYENNYRSLKNHFVHPTDSNLPAVIRDAIENLWIGEVDGDFYSCVLPLHAKADEEQFFREFAERTEGIFFVNKVRDISAQLDILSKTMLLMLAAAFAAVIVILFFCYRPRLVLKIAAIPLTVTLVTTATLLLCRIHLSFFPITALVLVFGLGLDYIIYAIEGSEKKSEQTNDSSKNLNNFAILLSFVTTALSFGALTISTFPPVHILGLTVFAGLTTAVVSALCMTK